MSQWPMVKLGDVAQIISGLTFKKTEVKDQPDTTFNCGVIRATNFHNSTLNLNNLVYAPNSIVKQHQLLSPNDIAIIASSGSLTTIGNVALVDFNKQISFGAFLRVIRIKSDRILAKFLFHFLSSNATQKRLKSLSQGANIKNLRQTDLLNLKIPLPPLEEQRRITKLIKNADDQYLNTKKQNNLLKESILSFLVPRLRANSKEVPLRNIITEITSGLSPKCESGSAQDNEYGVLKLSAVTSGQYIPTENKLYTGPLSNIEKYLVEEGDILMTRKNTPELVGAVAIASETSSHLAIPDLIYKIQIDESCISRQVFQKIMILPLMRERIKSICSGSNTSMSNISQKRLLNVKFPLPTVELHKELISLLLQSHKLEQELSLKSQKLEELHQSLATRAFAGQL
ncbi:restriction endonuclease subunit S [Corynebacterium amycolatum]|uniref:restriction endonuclease subunit S n=1 Tax=Corynebacterium amycolatum TaxID=43765 RepID=UPI00211A2F2F|nr:restriction endonuclease subunit S [Corynebacterium amycolatum]MCQ9126480.1 restriction endonuclease subunit S [Corynebacterium amycolatum]MCQ9128647.1 restriction endonuclease subunit S [Corynebacterium amycolatum]MCQ9140947.1 restriction endonuclease subunit S [Corynebacterium amycolatum]MCQ9166216.1 restriction endonuclease subunit S [Corynebacterium amycolatum]MCQ9170442.1 restriction endonuclease subunit S [Corynebacterium amycolatum]